MIAIRRILVALPCLAAAATSARADKPACKVNVSASNDQRAIVLADAIDLSTDSAQTLADATPLANCTPSAGNSVNRTTCPDLFDPRQLRGKASVQIGSLCVLPLSTLAAKAVADNLRIELGDDRKLDLSKLTPAPKRILFTSQTPGVLAVVEDIEGSPELPPGFEPSTSVAFVLVGPKLHSITFASARRATREPDVVNGEITDRAAAELCNTRTSAADKRNFNVLCFVGDTRRLGLVGSPSDGGTVMRPNRSILVLVVRTAGESFAVTVDGDFGVFTPGVRDETPRDPAKGVATARPEDAVLVDRHAFGSRLPGKASVHVRPTATGSAVSEAVVELFVEQTYAGALRVGLGGVFGGAVDRGFTLRTAPGSGQQEIAAANGGDMDAELVIGASMFLERGGRGYAVPGHNIHVAPYLGIGILNQTDSGLKGLHSLHLGLEYELNSHFSIAVTAIARRITRLSGAKLGDPVQMSGSIPTETGFAFGWGIVINLSPDFLRLAARSGSSYFGS